MGYAMNVGASRSRRNLTDVSQHVLSDARGAWGVVVPEETTNLITNPSAEIDATGYTATAGATLGRTTADQAFGIASVNVQSTGDGEGFAYSVTTYTSDSTTYTLSVWLYGKGRVVMGGVGNVSGGAVSPPFMISSAWRRYSYTFRYGSGNAARTVAVLASGANSVSYFLDGMQLEAKTYPTTYCDGDQEDCAWLNTPHVSRSYRSAQTRKGGRVWNFRDFKFSVNAIVGAGAAALTTIATPYALTGGGFYQRSVAPPRTFQIVGGFECDSDVDLKRSRRTMLNALKPYLRGDDQKTRLIYQPGPCDDAVGSSGRELVVDAVYAGGLEGNWTNEFGRENAALAFQSFLPFASIGKSAIDEAAALTNYTSQGTSQVVLRRSRVTGVFEVIHSSFSDSAYFMTPDLAGGLYIGGAFGSPQTRIAYWNGTTLAGLGTGANNPVYAGAVDVNNQFIAGGSFTSIGGTVVTGIARWNGSTWSAIGGSVAGGGAIVNAVLTDSVGGIYIGGSFTSVNGVAADNVAYWNGSVWNPLGTGTNGQVYSMVVGKDALIYVGGAFSTAGGTSAGRFARWNGSTWAAVGGDIGTGGDYVTDIKVGPDSRIYIGGSFATAGGNTATNLAVWNGSVWSALGLGVNGGVDQLNILPDGRIIVSGAFTTAGALSLNRIAMWTGSDWIPADMYLSGVTTLVNSTAHDGLYEYYQTYGTTVNLTAGSTSVVNSGEDVSPEVRFSGVGRMFMLKNWTTGTEIRFNLNLLSGEKITLKTGDNPSLTSNTRGDITQLILPSSDASQFRLVNGTNYISFLTENAGMVASMVWREHYDTLDHALVP